jgi:hypothetical protein
MSDELKFPDGSRRPHESGALDERTAQLIRQAYLPPTLPGDAETVYWSALESRIMARVAGAGASADEAGWWSVLGGWSQVGLVAAAALFAAASLLSHQLGEPDDTQVSYEAVMPTSSFAASPPVQLITSSDRATQRDAALQYVLSY